MNFLVFSAIIAVASAAGGQLLYGGDIAAHHQPLANYPYGVGNQLGRSVSYQYVNHRLPQSPLVYPGGAALNQLNSGLRYLPQTQQQLLLNGHHGGQYVSPYGLGVGNGLHYGNGLHGGLLGGNPLAAGQLIH